MTNRSNILLILSLTLILSVVLPILFRDNSETVNQTLNIIATLTSSIASLLTLIIAILLFNKFGIETPLLQKNTDVVFSFLEEFKKTGFKIEGQDVKFVLFIRVHHPIHKHFEERYSEKLLFSANFISDLEKLMKIAESPFMPKSIYDKVIKLNFFVLSYDVKDEDIKNYATVEVLGQQRTDAKFGRFNHQDMTLFGFLNIIDEIKTELIEWINKHSNYSPDLNI